MKIKQMIRKIMLEDFRWSKEYQAFRKYAGRDDIYIRFAKSPIIKKIFSKHIREREGLGDHGDPFGIYGFSLSFVLKNYENLFTNVFFSMPYIAVLRDTSKNKFVISQPITYGEALHLLAKLFNIPVKQLWELFADETVQNSLVRHIAFLKKSESENREKLKKHFFEKILNQSSDAVDNAVFYRLTKINDKQLREKNKDIALVSGDVQRFRWIRSGYDCIEDKNGVIYPGVRDEKEQIIFLTEDSFEVVEHISQEGIEKSRKYTFPDEQGSGDFFEDHRLRIPYFMRRILTELSKELGDSIRSITSEYEIIQQYGRNLKNFSYFQEKDIVNKDGSTSEAQSIVGKGKKFDIQVLAMSHLNHSYLFEIGIFEAKRKTLLFQTYFLSEKYNSFDEFIKDAKQKIKLKKHIFDAIK